MSILDLNFSENMYKLSVSNFVLINGKKWREKLKIVPSLRFYVKSIFKNLEPQNKPNHSFCNLDFEKLAAEIVQKCLLDSKFAIIDFTENITLFAHFGKICRRFAKPLNKVRHFSVESIAKQSYHRTQLRSVCYFGIFPKNTLNFRQLFCMQPFEGK